MITLNDIMEAIRRQNAGDRRTQMEIAREVASRRVDTDPDTGSGSGPLQGA